MTAAPLRLDHVTLAVTSLERSGPYYDALLPLLGFRKESDLIWTDGEGFFFQSSKPVRTPVLMSATAPA